MNRRHFLSAGLLAASGIIAANRASAFGTVAEEKRKPNFGRYNGVVSVTVTPYNDDHSVDGPSSGALSAKIAQAGVDGLFLAGSTGDMGLLSVAERVEIIKAGRKNIPAETKIYSGASDYSIDLMVENTKKFADAGADVAVIMAPLMFFKFSQAELVPFFREIADRSALPVLLYHHVRVSSPIEPETVAAICDHPNLIGMKETGANYERTTELMKVAAGHDFIFMQGNEPYVVDSLRAGADGVLSALAGVWPELFVELVGTAKRGEKERFDRAAEKLNSMCDVFKIMPTADSFSYFGWSLKRMLQYRGWFDNTRVRMPGFTADPAWDEKLVAFLADHDFPRS